MRISSVVLDCRRIAWGRGAQSMGWFGIRPGLGSLQEARAVMSVFAIVIQSLFRLLGTIKWDNHYRELQQLLESGERGVLAADDDCLRSLLRRRGLPSRSWLRSGDKWERESRLLLQKDIDSAECCVKSGVRTHFEVLMSGLKLSRRACLSTKLTPSLGPPSLGLSAGCWGCDPRLDHEGVHDSS